MRLDKNLPVLLPERARSALSEGMVEATTCGLAGLVGAAASAADLTPLLAEELLRHLHRKLHEARLAEDRSAWFGGRIYNALTGERLYYIPLSGRHLEQVLALSDVEMPCGAARKESYLLRVDIARAAHDRLGTQLGVPADRFARGL